MNTTMKKSNIPLRRCMATGEQLPKSSLIRLVRTPDDTLIIDLTPSNKVNGRGAYLKKDPTLIEKVKNGKLIQKHLNIEPTEAFYQELESVLNG